MVHRLLFSPFLHLSTFIWGLLETLLVMSNHRTCISDLLISWPVLVSWHLLYRFDPKLDICFSVGKMPECQRGGVDPTRSWKRNEIADDLTGSSTENKTICKREETTGLSISGLLVLFIFLQTLRPLLWLAYRTPLYDLKLPTRLNTNREGEHTATH